MNKSFLIFGLCMLLSLVFVSANENFTYIIENDTVRITGFNQSALGYGDLVLPDLIEGFPVTVIGERAFEYHEFTGGLVLPVFLEVIELRAFYTFTYAGFTGELVLPSSLKVIEDGALTNRFTGELVFPEGLIVAGGFQNTNLYGDIILPEGLTTITNTGFYQNNFNGTVYLPGSLSSIGQTAFYNNQIKEVVFSENFSTSIASRMFHANLLTSLNLPEGVGSIGGSAFRDNLLSGELVLNITGLIYEFAFENNNLDSVIFGEGVSEIRRVPFYNNPNLSKAVFFNKDIVFYLLSGSLPSEIFNQEHVDIIAFRYKSDGVTDSDPYAHASSREFLTFRNIEGCTDIESMNYDEYALLDDGSCVPIVLGCMDPEATNYDEAANTDDGSCEYLIQTGGGGGAWPDEEEEESLVAPSSSSDDDGALLSLLNQDGEVDSSFVIVGLVLLFLVVGYFLLRKNKKFVRRKRR